MGTRKKTEVNVMSETIVKIENLVKRYKDVLAVDHFNLEIKEGEVLGVIGYKG